jgi:hypothetical protein
MLINACTELLEINGEAISEVLGSLEAEDHVVIEE